MTREEAKLTIDYLKEMQEEYIEGEGYERHPLPEWYALDKAIEAIEQTTWILVTERPPKEGQEVRHGKWENGKCSICGEHALFWMMASTYYASPYCPNCGAKME